MLDEGLVEMDQGTLEGLPAELLARDHAALLAAWREDPGAVTLPGGEAMREVQRRGTETLRRLAIAHADAGTLVVVTHQLLLSAVLCGLAREPLHRWRAWSHRNTAWCELEWDEVPRIVAHDVAPHVQTEG
jgi:broad specificity phosphatase PhoE